MIDCFPRRLTESAAFFFIPLSFTATFFGMQVREISDSDLPIWLFFVLALTITASSYGLRLLIRSHNVLAWVDKCQTGIRELNEVPRGRPIRTTHFLRWIVFRATSMKTSLLLLFWLLVTLLPLIPVWKSTLNRSIKWVTTVTILTVSGLILVFYALTRQDILSARIWKKMATKIFT